MSQTERGSLNNQVLAADQLAVNRGPAHSALLHGEMIAVGFSARVGRGGRSYVNVRVVGNSSLGWIEAAYAWGARIDAIVLSNGELNDRT